MVYNKDKETWVACPLCKAPKLIKLRPDTQIKNFPAYCKRCRREVVITIERRAHVRGVTIEPEPRA